MTEQVTNALQLPFSSKKYLNSNSPTVIPPPTHTHIKMLNTSTLSRLQYIIEYTPNILWSGEVGMCGCD